MKGFIPTKNLSNVITATIDVLVGVIWINISEVTQEEAFTEEYSQSNDDVCSEHETIVEAKKEKKSSSSSITKVNLNNVS